MSNWIIDFSVVLSLLTIFTGVFWVWDRWWLAPRRAEIARKTGVTPKPNGFIDFCQSFFPVIALVLFLRSFVAEPFRIPSGSMIPTLSVGDFILVNKWTYGLRDPMLRHKFVKIGEPQRGDVAVFRWPVDPSKDFIKRIIGLPGDRIAYRDKTLYLNGEKMKLEADGVFGSEDSYPPGMVYRFNENLQTVSHAIIVNPNRPTEDIEEFVVPEGHYFAMGDNRDGSDDSRRWGFVPEANLVGKAFFIWMSWNSADMQIEFSRIGTRIH